MSTGGGDESGGGGNVGAFSSASPESSVSGVSSVGSHVSDSDTAAILSGDACSHASDASVYGTPPDPTVQRVEAAATEATATEIATEATAASTGQGGSDLLSRLGIPTIPLSESSFAPVASGAATVPPNNNNGNPAVFGGGRGWAGWDREEGHRALGQSYQRHTNLLRDADAGSETTDLANNPYDVDEFGSVSMGESKMSRDSSGSGSGSGSGASHSAGRSSGRSSAGRSGGKSSSGKSSSGSGSGKDYSSGSGSRTTVSTSDPTRIFGRVIRPSREGLAAQTLMAKRRHSLRTMGRENFLSSMEQGDHLEKRRMSGIGPGKILDECLNKENDSKFPRVKTMRLVCAAFAAVSALTAAVVMVALPDSTPAVLARNAAVGTEEAFRTMVGRSHASPGPAPAHTREIMEGKRDKSPSSAAASPGAQEVSTPEGKDANVDAPLAIEGTTGTADVQQAQPSGENEEERNLEKKPTVMNGIDVLAPLTSFNTANSIEEKGIFIPSSTADGFVDIWDPPSKEQQSGSAADVPVLWHIPRSSVTTLKSVFGKCTGLVAASSLGASQDQVADAALEVYLQDDGVKYVNVDPTSLVGLERAKRLDLVGSNLADVIISPLFNDVSSLFNTPRQRRGRAFAMFRHPVKQAVSLYYYLQSPEWQPANTAQGAIKEMTLLEYAKSDLAEENWLVRSLTNEYEEALTDQHVNAAKEVVRRKVLVGIAENFEESFARFNDYFGWSAKVAGNRDVLECQKKEMAEGDNRDGHPNKTPGSDEFKALAVRNWADVELYHYVKLLFKEQESLVREHSYAHWNTREQ